MSVAGICNGVAWILCGVVAFLLMRDFLHTERKERSDTHEADK